MNKSKEAYKATEISMHESLMTSFISFDNFYNNSFACELVRSVFFLFRSLVSWRKSSWLNR